MYILQIKKNKKKC